MRRAHSLLVVAALLLAFFVEPAPALKTPAPGASAAAAAPDVRTVVGQIMAIDAAKGSMTVGESLQASRPKTAKLRETVTLTLDDKTQVFRGKRTATKEELHAHDHVVVRYVVTPQGPRALSCRASDTVARKPSPTATPGGSAAGVGGTTATN
jgi:hypothetical protein